MSRAPSEWRGRIAKSALLIGAVVVGGVVARAYPRAVSLRYELGADHAEVVEARLVYLADEEELATMTLRRPEGLPDHFRHEVELSPGRYVVEASLVDEAGVTRRLERAFEVPADGVLRIDLGEGR